MQFESAGKSFKPNFKGEAREHEWAKKYRNGENRNLCTQKANWHVEFKEKSNSKLTAHSPDGDVIIEGSRYPDRTAETRSISLTQGKELWLEKHLKLLDPAGTTHTRQSFPSFCET